VILQEIRQEQQAMQKEEFHAQLEKFHESLKKGMIPVEFLQEILRELPENPVHRGVFLGSILSYIGEKRKFSVAYTNNRFELTGKTGHVESEKTLFEELLNSHIQNGKITSQDVLRAFLYRTYEELEKYAQESGEQASQEGFVRSLLSKNTHLREFLPSDNEPLTHMIDTEEKYTQLLTKIRRHVSNQTHQEFLLTYFTQLKTQPDTEDISPTEYTKQVDELQKSIMSRMQEINQILEEN